MAMVGWRSLLGFQVERWIAIWVFLAGTSRGLEIERWSRMGPCAPGKSFGMCPWARQHLGVKETGRGGRRGCERGPGIQVRFLSTH